MNRKDIGILAVLILLLLLWPMVGPLLERKLFPGDDSAPVSEELAEPQGEETGEEAGPVPSELAAAGGDAGEAITVPAAEPIPSASLLPEETVTLSNEVVAITVSSRGGAVNEALISQYRSDLPLDSSPVELVFTNRRALAYLGLAGLGEASSFRPNPERQARSASFAAATAQGIRMRREYALDEAYMLRVTDTFLNASTNPVVLPDHAVQLGVMDERGAGKSLYVPYSLGVDVLLDGGEGVKFLGKKVIPRRIKGAAELTVEDRIRSPVEWVAVKNRFFTQILNPEEGGEGVTWSAAKENPGDKAPSEVSASMDLAGTTIAPGGTFARVYSFYVGPKKYSVIREYRRHQEKVMDFGLFTPICKFLLWVLNGIHDYLWPHNYGLAIILLTILIRILFWPITHRGTESMRKMQEIQPLMQELREKHKDNPQKQQQELFALYKEHKINPLGGCLPMFIQIPVFFALFTVLRSAIELRFAGFLWIRDLTQPEGLFSGFLPFGGLNILPIVMSAMMIWQQKMMPTSADPRQARVMQFMPVFMLFLFYPAPSGLALYWTTNQCSMIVQQYLHKKRKERLETGSAANRAAR